MKTNGRKTVGEKISAPKAVKVAPSKTAVAMPAGPTHDEIAKRAYEMYLERGAVDGYAHEDWARAVAELTSR